MTQASREPDFEDLYENAPCGLLLIAPDGRVIQANRTLLELAGFAKEELVGEPFHKLLTITGRIFYEAHVAPILHMQGYFNEATLDLATKTGDRLPMLGNALERRDGNGNLISVGISLFKATERRLFERELISAQAVSDAKLNSEREISQLREQFIAVLGHDLQNPLASLDAGLRLLRREMPNERAAKVFALMQGSITRMAGVIDNVLDFARGRMGGGLTIHAGKVRDLEPVLNQILEEYRSIFPDRSVEKQFDLQPFAFDPSRMGQLFSNLLGNAFVHGDQLAPIRVGALTRDGTFTLWVANQGKAIPPEVTSRLFEPFFRGDGEADKSGLGLGLHIASEIAKAHGGALVAKSSDNETRFILTMPMN